MIINMVFFKFHVSLKSLLVDSASWLWQKEHICQINCTLCTGDLVTLISVANLFTSDLGKILNWTEQVHLEVLLG